MRSLWPSLCVFVIGGCAAAPDADGPSFPEPVVLKRNGGWCWYQDERAIVIGSKLIFGSVAGTSRDGSERGDVQVTSYDLDSGRAAGFTLAEKFQSDDHDVPALLELPDGRVLASFMTHGGSGTSADTRSMYWRISARAGDVSAWTPVRSTDVSGSISYSNLFRLGAEGGRIYNFHRSGRGETGERNPHFVVSDDNGETFVYGGRLLKWARPTAEDPSFTGIDGGRPYLKYASDGVDTIHFIATEDHPRAYDNSIYHGFLRDGRIFRSDGTEVASIDPEGVDAPSPTDLTPVFQGDHDHVAWTVDLHLDKDGHPYCVFSVQRDGAPERGNRGATSVGQDHRYYYARWDGERWHADEMAFAGTRLYQGEDDYTGLAALDPMDPYTVFISTDADPSTGEPLVSMTDGQRHYEIFRGRTGDRGQNWTWTAVTSDSTADNLRPIVPTQQGGEAILLWLHGEYRTYTDYDLDVVGLIGIDAH